MKRLKTFIVACVICLIAVATFPIIGEAAAKKPSCEKSKTVYWTKVEPGYEPGFDGGYNIVKNKLKTMSDSDIFYIKINNISPNAKVTAIKSSNKKVVSNSDLEYFYSSNSGYIAVFPKGWFKGSKIPKGTTTISFKIKQNGKTYKLSCKYTIKRRPSPFASLKIGGKEYTSKLNGGSGILQIKTQKSSVKISFKGAKHVKSVKAYYYDETGKKVQIKNNTAIPVPPKGTVRWIDIYYKYKGNSSALKKWYKKPIQGDDCIAIRLER